MNNKMMNRKWISLVLAVTLLIIMLIAFISPTSMDKLLLLELQHPGYWNYLSENSIIEHFHVVGNSNKLVFRDIDKSLNGLHVTVDTAGKVVINGCNNGDGVSINITSQFQLENGTYELHADGLDRESDVNLFIYGIDRDGQGHYMAETKKKKDFSATEEYISYSTRLYAPPNSSENNVSFQLSLFKKNESEGGTKDYDDNVNSENVEKYGLVYISRNELNELNPGDFKVFKRVCERRGLDWVSVIYNDTAIQLKNNRVLYGKANFRGVVNDEIEDITDTIFNGTYNW